MTRRDGFTLIELLVVITIIALLLALLFPALGTMQERAQGSACLSNMRQLAVAWMAYASDYHGKLAGAETDREWDWIRERVNSTNAIMQGVLFRYVNNLKTYQCPSDDSGHVWSYSIVGPIGGGGGPQTPVLQLSDIQYAGRQVLFVEETDPRGGSSGVNQGAFWMRGPTGSFAGWTSSTDWPAWGRHRTSMNLVFVDGHGETWTASDPNSPLIVNCGQTFDSTNPDYRRFWNVYYPQ